MKVSLIDIILIVLFFQLLSLIPFLLFGNKKKRYSHYILAAFLLAKALCISNFVAFNLYNYTYKSFPHLFYLGSSFTILWGPILYLYVKSLVIKNFRFSKKDILHFIPFTLHFLYLVFTFHIYDADTKRMLMNEKAIFSSTASTSVYGFIHLSILIYTTLSFRMIILYRSEIKNKYSSIDSINLSWMLFILIGFASKWFFDVIYYFNSNFFNIQTGFATFSSKLLLFLFINIMIYKGLMKPEIFSGIQQFHQPKKLYLSKSLQKEYLDRLSLYMENNKPYLDPSLSLIDLSKKLSIPHRSLSEVINNSVGKNFYDFINGYRIKESQRLLTENSSPHKTILEIIYEVGYNSKSSFNNAFKKYTGMTPTEYKRLYQN